MKNVSLFIGSSGEGLDAARAIGYQLREDAEVTIWNEGVFKPGEAFLESLVNSLDRFDFAVLVLTPDDPIIKRDKEGLQPRDNLMFELGLFMGRLGRARTFAVCPYHAELMLPTDLAGVTTLKFEANRPDKNIIAGVSAASVVIRETMRDLGSSETKGLKKLNQTATNVEDRVSEVLNVLIESRIWETELFRTQYRIMLNKDDISKLEQQLAKLKNVSVKKQEPENSK